MKILKTCLQLPAEVTQQSQYQSQPKIEELESIRGLAALLIVIHHIPLWNLVNNSVLIRNGYMMVQLFFVLSGFVIYTAYSDRIKTKKDLLRFQFLRLGRLYPVHLFFLTVYVFIEAAKYYAQNKLGITSPNTRPFRENSVTALWENIFLVQAIGPTNNDTTFNVPAWSISVEFYTYLLFGIAILNFEKSKILVFLGLMLTSLYLLISHNEHGFERLLSCYSGFFLGCIVAYLKEKITFALPSHTASLALLAIVLFLIFKTNPDYDPIIYFLTAILILAITTSQNGSLNKVLRLRLFTWLGTISFSLYMCHFSIIWSVNQFIRVILKRPEVVVDGVSAPQLSDIETLVAMTFVVVAVLTVSTFVYKYIENPFRLKSRQYALNKIG